MATASRPAKIEIGTTFHRWKVVEVAPDANKPNHVLVACACGSNSTKLVYKYDLLSGKSTSCGCVHREVLAAKNTVLKTKHGLHGTKIYSVWHNMLSRCYNIKNTRYADYGGRGIKVCERWHNVLNFYEDMGKPPYPGATIERVDTMLGYEVANCVWADRTTQSNNTRRSVRYTINGVDMSLAQISEEYNIKLSTLRSRIYGLGMTAENAIKYGKRVSTRPSGVFSREDGHKLYNPENSEATE